MAKDKEKKEAPAAEPKAEEKKEAPVKSDRKDHDAIKAKLEKIHNDLIAMDTSINGPQYKSAANCVNSALACVVDAEKQLP